MINSKRFTTMHIIVKMVKLGPRENLGSNKKERKRERKKFITCKRSEIGLTADSS